MSATRKFPEAKTCPKGISCNPYRLRVKRWDREQRRRRTCQAKTGPKDFQDEAQTTGDGALVFRVHGDVLVLMQHVAQCRAGVLPNTREVAKRVVAACLAAGGD